MQSWGGMVFNGSHASITICNVTAEPKARLRPRAQQRGSSLEALTRSILDRAAEETPSARSFPQNLLALVEPGEDIEPFIREHGRRRSR